MIKLHVLGGEDVDLHALQEHTVVKLDDVYLLALLGFRVQ